MADLGGGAEGAAAQGGRFERAANLAFFLFLLWVFLPVRYIVHLNK